MYKTRNMANMETGDSSFQHIKIFLETFSGLMLTNKVR